MADCPVTASCMRLASRKVVVWTILPFVGGMPGGTYSLGVPYTVCIHSFCSGCSPYGLVVRDASPEADGPMGMLHEVTDQGGQHEVQHGSKRES